MKIPVLMYHDVLTELDVSGDTFKSVPPYGVDARAFEEQLKLLADSGYKSILFEELESVLPNQKYVILTFDDGLAGNFKLALPILKKYGFRAVFYVIAGSVGKPGYMTWDELKTLSGSGMSVQSHTLNHESLETLSMDTVNHELRESRKIIEKKLGSTVNSISFPHGSYNARIIKAAFDNGYTFICTSDMVVNSDFSAKPAVFGRIAVKWTLDIRQFAKLISFNRYIFLKHRTIKNSKTLIRSMLGIRNYGRLYHLFYRTKKS